MNQESFGLWSRDDLEAWEMHDWSQPGDDVNRALRHKVPDAAAIRFKSWSALRHASQTNRKQCRNRTLHVTSETGSE
jgi:hypothetical protein